MGLRTSAVVLVLLAWLAAPAAAQDSTATSPQPQSRATAAAAEKPAAEVARLPVDLERLQRRLRESAARDASGGPKIRFDVNVYAAAPRITIIRPEDNVRTGQPRWSAPSHQEMMNIVTPQPFRHMPGMSLDSVMRWLSGDNKGK
jgi:hypothetical protein